MGGPERSLRVLVVEDEPVNRALLRAVLEKAATPALRGAEVIEVASLADARAAMTADGDLDIVILDVRLPDGNGLDLARELAQESAAKRPRILVMSASVLAADRDAAQRSGADRFLPKPFKPTDLIALLEELAAG